MKGWLLWLGWVAVVGVAGFLRFDGLAERPFHADEATGARITGQRMAARSYVFDPLHYHGPSLSAAGMLAARVTGAEGWRQLEKGALRAVPAVAGTLLVLVPLMGVRRFGHGPMWLGALALATSPLLVYYSRMYIHEMLLALCGALALGQLLWGRGWWLAGIWVGLMFATKETFVISLLAWGGAALGMYGVAWATGKAVPRPAELARRYGAQAAAATGLALLVAMAFYTNGFTYAQGAVDAFRTYFVYEVVEGHDKPPGYYARLLLWPEERGGQWWFETGLVGLAGVAWIGRGFSAQVAASTRVAIQFLGFSALLHLVIYSAFAYKTPWLVTFPWVQVAMLAGFVGAFRPSAIWLRGAGVVAVAVAMATQWVQARQVTGKWASDSRNPYAYVPTSEDIEALGAWLDSLGAAVPEIGIEPVGVVGSEYWPLPWYLRQFEKVGYWAEVPDQIERLPVVVATTDLAEALAASHVPVPRGLRAGKPMTVWVRDDVWDASVRPR